MRGYLSRLEKELASPEIDRKSSYENRNLADYVSDAVESVKKYFTGLFGAAPAFNDAKVRVRELPTQYAKIPVYDGRSITERRVPVGKVFGSYNPSTNDIELDSSLFDIEKKSELEKYGFKVPSAERVIGEEAIHHVQKKIGSMARAIRKYGDYARDYIEGAASSIADYLFGDTSIYGYEKQLFAEEARKKGVRDAFLIA